MRQRSLLYSLSVLGICLFFSACSKKEHIAEPQQQAAITESAEANHNMEGTVEKEGISQKEFYEKYGAPVVAYNRFDAANFISLIQDMQKSVHNDILTADLQQLIDLTILAQETHEMEYANQIYKILHDLDYFLLRYGIEDVGKYTKDGSTVATYYGVLAVYGANPFEADL